MRTPTPRRSLRTPLAIGAVSLAALLAGCSDDDAAGTGGAAATSPAASSSSEPATEPTPSETAADPTPSETAERPSSPRVVGTVATGLEAPWGLDFLPDGSALVTERDTTRLLHLTPRGEEDGQGAATRYRVREVATIDAAAPQGESGLLGVAVSPTFADDQQVFLYVSTEQDNRVLRGTFDGTDLGRLTPILTGIPNGFIHDGGRLAFGPDGYLYVSTGEIGEPSLAQDRSSLGGKILRITADGDPAPGNPDGSSPIWTLGHRNVQGLAFDDRDRLWASEFGQDTWDELNRIRKGSNYGWPAVEGRAGSAAYPAYVEPARQWATSEASPSGLAYADGSLWMAALRGNRLWEVPVTADGTRKPRPHLVGDYGRLRTVALAPDGRLWVTTSNRDGRGDPAAQDDRILVVSTGRAGPGSGG